MPSPDIAHFKEWTEKPSAAEIADITDRYEAVIRLEDKDPLLGAKQLTLTTYLMEQGLVGDKMITYHHLITEELERRHPNGQLEFRL